MSDIPNVGTKDQLPPNDTATQQTGRNGLVTFYPTGTNQDLPAVISINGDNGGIDIGGTREKHGKLLLRDKFMTITYIVDGETGKTSQSGDICLYDADGNERLCISGKTADVTIKSAAGDLIIHLDGKAGDLILGGNGQKGDLIVKNSAGDDTILLDGHQADVIAGGNGRNGDVIVRTSADGDVIRLKGDTGEALVGGNGRHGHVSVRNSGGSETIRLDGNTGNVTADGTTTTQDLTVNGSTTTQDLTVNGATTTQDLTVNGAAATQDLTVNGTATIQDLTVDGETIAQDLTVGGATTTKDITVTNAAGDATIELDGNAGDIRLLAADCAEDFDVADAVDIVPGTVVIFNQEGKLCPSAKAYDKRIAGVISGAGDYRPGIVLDQQQASQSKRLPVALMGKVYCQVDATDEPIGAGDLLTTAHMPGHAMKANDAFEAVGAVVGRALRPLESGTGLIPILVA